MYVYKNVLVCKGDIYLPMLPFNVKLIINLNQKNHNKTLYILNYFAIRVFDLHLFFSSNIYQVFIVY